MKHYLGIFIFLFSLNSLAGEGKSAVLVLRAIVPEQTKFQIVMGKKGPTAQIHSNLRHHKPYHKLTYSKTKQAYLVSITHP